MAEPGYAPDHLKWISAYDAGELVFSATKDRSEARRLLTDRAAVKLVHSRCRKATVTALYTAPDEREFTPLPDTFWQVYRDPHQRLAVSWFGGDFAVQFVEGHDDVTWRAFNVEFCEDDIRREFRGLDAASKPPIGPGWNEVVDPFLRAEWERFAAQERSKAISGGQPPSPPRSIASASNAEYPGENLHGVDRRAAPPPSKKRLAPKRRAPQKPKTPVTHAEFMAWYETLSMAEQALGYRRLWAKAKWDFRPRKGIPRLWAEEITEGRDRGRISKA